MRKLLLTTVTFLGSICLVKAQNASATASQTASLSLSNAISISYTGTGNTTGSTVSLAFNSVLDLLTGLTSSAQQLKVQSNLPFDVSVKYDANSLLYVGIGILNITLLPSNMYQVKVTANGTGGNIASPFSSTSYANITANAQDIIQNGTNGSNQTFSVMYKVVPGLLLPSGIVSMNVVYTATQL